MTHIKGITVVLIDRCETGVDPFGQPVFEEKEEPVENVLIKPNSTEDMQYQMNLTGEKAVYTMAIPKGDTHDWEDKTVKFFGRTWKTIGIPLEGIDAMIPLEWNRKVQVKLDEHDV